MIRISYMSDLHLEFERNREFVGSEPWYALRDARNAVQGHPAIGPLLTDLQGQVDLVVLAGDIDNGVKGIHYANEVQRFLGAPVICISGNHEHYGQLDYDATVADLRAAADPGVHVLERDRVDLQIGGERLAVLGTTLWTDYLAGEPFVPQEMALNLAWNRINDHGEIHRGGQEFGPRMALDEHRASRAWLEAAIPEALAEADAVLVVTHHAPVLQAVQGRRQRGVEWAYGSDLKDVVGLFAGERAGWIYGHTHAREEHDVGGVSVATAARGYVDRRYP